MARSLYTASTYQVHYSPSIIHGGESQDIIKTLLGIFDISTNANNEYDDEFEVERSELVRLGEGIRQSGDTEEEVITNLQKLKMSKEEFLKALDDLINNSDQSNEYVLLSWF